jgi:hypothetical protein
MGRTTFSGPVKSDNGFEGNMVSGTISSASANITNLVAGTASATVLRAASATITNLIATSAKISNVTINQANAASGAVSAQLGFIPVLVGSTTAYIALYKSVTV